MFLAKAQELDNGAFKAIHKNGDPVSSDGQPDMPAHLKGMLGLYWGCQDIDPALPGGGAQCQPYSDPRGAPFHRGEAECRMRRSRYTFCRVCAHRMAERIAAATV
jgi:hypothetical protein